MVKVIAMRCLALLALCLPALSFAASDEAEWRMPAKDYAGTRYSSLNEIRIANVKDPKLAFRFDTGIEKGHEAAPLVAEGLIFIVTPYPNHVFALDFKGRVRWKFDPKTRPSSQGVADRR
jgi:glucose dehydrogenase